MKQKLIKILRQLRAKFPSKLPTGLAEFNTWADSFDEIYDLPTRDKDSLKHVLSSGLINKGPTTTHMPKEYFYKLMVGAASKQVAAHVFQVIQQAKFAAEKVAKRADDAKLVPNETL